MSDVIRTEDEKLTDVCSECLQQVQSDWTYCPYCGAQGRLEDPPCEICGLPECIGNCNEELPPHVERAIASEGGQGG
jgi:hypothetical protein